MRKCMTIGIMMTLAMSIVAVISATNIVPVFADKNAQAECINNQNELFIGNEQKGDAYKQSKDTCQQLD